MQVRDWALSLIRTYVPIGVGALASWLLSLGLDVGAQANVGLVTFGTALLTAAYYLIARTLEARFPKLGGLLLGAARQPEYDTPAPSGMTSYQSTPGRPGRGA